MQNYSTLIRRAGLFCWIVASGCDGATDASHVEFAESQQIGRWQAEPPSAGSPGLPADKGAPPPAMTPIEVGKPGPLASAGTGALAPTAGKGPQTGASGSGMAGPTGAAGMPAAGGGAAGSSDSGGAVTSVAFDVKTEPVGGFYQPKNIGAIWVKDGSGKFMKSLEVWAGIRARYLTNYSSARAGMQVDVKASATLTSHKMHHATWDMKDRSGAAAPPGKYTLCIELTDFDFTGQLATFDFDTSKGPQTIMPPAALGFTMMKLSVQ